MPRANASEDKERREMVEIRNQAESLLHQTEKNLAEYGDKVPEADKSAIEGGVAELREALEGQDKAVIEAKMQALGQSSMKLGEAMYASEEAAGEADASAADAASEDEAGDDKVVDADFEEVDEDDPKNTAN